MSGKHVSTHDFQELLKRVHASGLSDDDKHTLNEVLTQTIALKKLVEDATHTSGGKKVLASLPFGFDIVK